MAKKKKSEPIKEEDRLSLARERLKKVLTAEADIRTNALENLRFVYNVEDGHWPDSIRKERANDNRPCLTSNKLRKYVAQVVNRERDQRIAGKVRPVDDNADVGVAKIIEGIIRQIEYASDANTAYTTAGEAAVAGGFGYWRIITKESDNSFEQDIYIKKIDNQFSVYLDPRGHYCFIREGMTKKEFENTYPGKLPSDFDLQGQGEEYTLWYEDDKVFVADYYYKEKYDKIIAQILNPMTGAAKIIEITDDVPRGTITAAGYRIVKEKTVKATRVKWERITGHEILEEGVWVGDEIPIIEVVGDSFNLAGKQYKNGLINDAKDPQRMYNFWLPLALNTKLPTPKGWTTMGEVAKGDELFDDKGNICSVLGTSPIYKDRTCYRITFDDGSIIDSDKDHLWQVEERGKRGAKTFQWLIKKCTTEQLIAGKHFIYATEPLKTEQKALTIHPYVLGVWLGDGDSHSAYITAGKKDIDEMVSNIEKTGYRVNPISWDKRTGAGRFSVCGLITQLKELSLIKNKHIPSRYMRASYEQRQMLLQGLMDTDGSISKQRLCSFVTTSTALRDGFSELLRTFGIKAVHCVRNPRLPTSVKYLDGSIGRITPRLIAYQFSFSSPKEIEVFNLQRKRTIREAKQNFHFRRTKRHGIISVQRIESIPVKCIKVTSKSHLFLAGEAMIPTHNTHMTETVALAPKSPYIVTPQEVKGHEEMWNTANIKNHPYLLVNAQGNTKPRREPPPQIPTGSAQMLQLAAGDIQDTIGMYQASFGEKSNERTGIAIRERAGRSEFGTYHFGDNFRRAVLASTKQLINIIPKIYDTQRIIRILGEDGQDELVKINETVMNNATGETHSINDLTIGKYDVVADVGLYSTRRQEAVQMMTSVIQSAPNIAPLMLDLLFKASDWPYADEIKKRLEKNLPALLGQKPVEGMPSPQEV